MSPAALLVLVALGVWLVQTSAQQRRRNPRRRRPGAGQLELPEAPAAYPVYSVHGGGPLPNRKKQPYWVFAQWAGVTSNDLRWFSHDPVGRDFSSYAEAADAARELARQGGVFEQSREQRRRLLNRNPSRRSGPTRRERWLADATQAGYSGDGRLWARTLAEARVNRAALEAAYRRGAGFREAELRRRNPRRRKGDRCYACGRPFAQGDRRYLMPTGLTGPRIVLCPSCADELIERREARGESGPALRPLNPRDVQTSAQPNPYTLACALPGGHVYDFTTGGRCQCCGRMAPKRTVELESRTGEHSRYGSTCAGRSIGTTKLRTNQLEHMEREQAEHTRRAAHYRGVGRAASRESGVVRPPYAWARSLSLAALTKIARDAGVSPYADGWWDTAELRPGGREMHYVGGVGVSRKRRRSGEYVAAVLEGGHRRDQRRAARTAAHEQQRPERRSKYAARPGEVLPF